MVGPHRRRGPPPAGPARPGRGRPRRRRRPRPQRPHQRGLDRSLATHLRALGVEFVTGTQAREVVYESGRVTGVRVSDRDGGAVRTIAADHYDSALPVEHARPAWGPTLRAADPQLARWDALETDWTVGVVLYLRTPVPVVHGTSTASTHPGRSLPSARPSSGTGGTFRPTTATAAPATASRPSSRSGTNRESCTARRPGGARVRRLSPNAGRSSRTPSTTPARPRSPATTVSAGSWTRR